MLMMPTQISREDDAREHRRSRHSATAVKAEESTSRCYHYHYHCHYLYH